MTALKFDSGDIINNLFSELRQLGNDLAMIGIKNEISMDKLGWGADGRIKYFLGVNFDW